MTEPVKPWMPRSETNDEYCDWLLAKGYDPADQEDDDNCYREYRDEIANRCKTCHGAGCVNCCDRCGGLGVKMGCIYCGGRYPKREEPEYERDDGKD